MNHSAAPPQRLSAHDAAMRLRSDPAFADLVRDAYIGEDTLDAARRFAASAEFDEVLRTLGDHAQGTVIDLGAGNGIASYAFASRARSARVIAVEPDPSDAIGAGAIRRIIGSLPIEIVDAVGERLPIPDATADVVFARQVLHHLSDLPGALREFARILKPGGLFLACREHVADDDLQLRAFLAAHPVHQMTGGEHAFRLDQYTGAIRSAGLTLLRTLGPYDSILNTFPYIADHATLVRKQQRLIRRRLGPLGFALRHVPACARWARARIDGKDPGRVYSFLAVKHH